MLVTMSDKELSRINVIQSVVEKRMRRRDAAHQLALTERQTQRLMNRFRESGAAGLANLRRGRPCTALVYVDDAISRMMLLLFVNSESTFTNFWLRATNADLL